MALPGTRDSLTKTTLQRGTSSLAGSPGDAPSINFRRHLYLLDRQRVDGWRALEVDDGAAWLTRAGIVAVDLGDGPTAWAGSTLDSAGRLV